MTTYPVLIICVYSLSVVLFWVVFCYSNIISTAQNVMKIARKAVTTIMDRSVDDQVKELATRKAAVEMLKSFIVITFKGAVVTVSALVPVLSADVTGAIPMEEMVRFSFRIETLLVTCVAVSFSAFIIHKFHLAKQNKTSRSKFSNQYSILDRSVHRIAFGSIALQEMLEDIESMLFRKKWAHLRINQPVFITSLPRAGTTVILEAFNRLPGFATHTYRDMPFLCSPVLWNKLSLKIRRNGVLRERAHGDGVIVSEDSSEAFEEVIWRKFFPENYLKDGLLLWDGKTQHAAEYFTEHLKKIIFLRCQCCIESARYVSKNNANIARIDAIRSLFDDAIIIVPLRDPVEQAISLWRQHMNFLEQHSKDRFVKRYMSGIGHYEFGLLHRPIQFPQFKMLAQRKDPKEVEYWLTYWVSAFDYLSGKDGVSFISYENLCKSPVKGLSRLIEYINGSADQKQLKNAAAIFRPPGVSRGIDHITDRKLTERAIEIYHDLKNRSILSRGV